MKIIGGILFVLFLALQYRIYLGESGQRKLATLQSKLEQQQQLNQQLKSENEKLRKEIEWLRHHPEALEEMAREQMGMVKPDETFYRIVPSKK